MPLYEFKCIECGHEFEELVPYEIRDDERMCKLCNKPAHRKQASVFGVHSILNPKKDTIVTNKEIDKVVGKDSEQKWAGYNEKWKARYAMRQMKRWGNKTPELIKIPKDADGKYSPIMHLGNSKDRSLRKEFSDALKEHRAEREKKGIPQFDTKGSIAES